MIKILRKLSDVDKKILKVILNPNEKTSSRKLSIQLGIARATVQVRRNFLEKHYLDFFYTLKLEGLGYRRVDLLISTSGGETMKLAEKLLDRTEVVYVATSIGEPTIDLRAEVIVKDNAELLNLLEEVKAMRGITKAIWSEVVHVVGRKRSVPSSIIDKM